MYSLRNTSCFTVDHAFSNHTCFFFLICVTPMEDEKRPSLLNLGFITANTSYSVFRAPHIILKHCQSLQVHQSRWEYFRGIVRGTLPYGNIFIFPSQHPFGNARILNHKQKQTISWVFLACLSKLAHLSATNIGFKIDYLHLLLFKTKIGKIIRKRVSKLNSHYTSLESQKN